MTSVRPSMLCVLLLASCFDPPEPDPGITAGLTATTGPMLTTTEGDTEDPPSTDTDVASETGPQTGSATTTTGPDDTTGEGSTGPTGPVCGNGEVEEGEECDDGNEFETDDCLSTCTLARCGDGFIYQGIEQCDDGNMIDTDACLSTCVEASCGDGVIYEGMEECDDGNGIDTDACLNACTIAMCGDGSVYEGVEECDDGNMVGSDGCGPTCLAECANPGGGSLTGDNGTNMGVTYCYEPGDSVQVRAQKACESHFGIGNCCIITGGYQDQQYGQCGGGGGAGSIHWHWDSHPAGHCDPLYVPGDVVAPGWCGVILGSFTA